MLKVCFCAYDQPGVVGGPVSWLMNLLPDLRKHGIEPFCLLFFHKGSSGPLSKFLESSAIRYKSTPFLPYTEENIRWILTVLNEELPDVFIPNVVVPAYYAAGWAKEAGICTIGISHSDDPFYHAIQQAFVDGSETFRLNGIVAVSRELERQLQLNNSPQVLNIVRIPCGVKIPQQTTRRDSPVLRVAYVGRLAEEQKRISEVTKSFCAMVREINQTEALIIGDGPDKDAVEAILAPLGDQFPVKLVGGVPNQSIHSYLLTCHVIVLLSDYEGIPVAIMEAMACGVVPVCLQMRSGIFELIENGKSGFIVSNRDEDFLHAIRRLREDRDLWETMSGRAKQVVSEQFSSDICHVMWADFLHSLRVSRTKHSISIPRKLLLPPVLPSLARADNRTPVAAPLWVRIYKKMRRMIVRIVNVSFLRSFRRILS